MGISDMFNKYLGKLFIVLLVSCMPTLGIDSDANSTLNADQLSLYMRLLLIAMH